MARVLDLNTAVPSHVLEVVMQDEARTTVRVGMPTEAMVQELGALSPELQKAIKGGTAEGIDFVYDLAARLLNRNLDGFTTTGEELRTKYKMGLESAVVFFEAYTEMLNEVSNAKN